jgi:hypothetical protein
MPHLEILKYAAENNIDLIIMGSHTKEKPGKWYPGSAVERVSYRVACPVVVVTDPGALAHWDRAKTALSTYLPEHQHDNRQRQGGSS